MGFEKRFKGFPGLCAPGIVRGSFTAREADNSLQNDHTQAVGRKPSLPETEEKNQKAKQVGFGRHHGRRAEAHHGAPRSSTLTSQPRMGLQTMKCYDKIFAMGNEHPP
jgi:hypothetical protein